MRYSWLLLLLMLIGGSGMVLNSEEFGSSTPPSVIDPTPSPAVVPEYSGITSMMIGLCAIFVLGSKRTFFRKIKKVV